MSFLGRVPLSAREKNNIASELYRRRLADEAQIRRCLAM